MEENFWSRKFLLTAGSLLAVFILFSLGLDVTKLEFIIPAILAFYHGQDVLQNMNFRRNDINIRSNQPLPQPVIIPPPSAILGVNTYGNPNQSG